MKRLGYLHEGYQFIPNDDCDLPDEFEVTIYIKSKGKENEDDEK